MPGCPKRREREKRLEAAIAAVAAGSAPPAFVDPPMPDTAPAPMRELLDALEQLGRKIDGLAKERASSSDVEVRRLPECSELTEDERGLVLGVAACGGGPAIAAALVGRSSAELKRMLKADAQFREQWEMAIELRNESVERSLVRNAIDGKNVAAQIFLSKQDRYLGFGDRTRSEFKGKVEHVFPQLVTGSMAPEVEAEARKQLATASTSIVDHRPAPEAA